jgi:hypothetical protein
MPQNNKVKISQKSALPYVAAATSLLSAVFIFMNYLRMRDYYPDSYIIYHLFLPGISMLPFCAFAVLLAKKLPQLILIPISLITLFFLMIESNILYYRYGYRFNLISKICIVLSCFLLLVIYIICLLTLTGAIKSKVAMISIYILNMLVYFMFQIRSYFYAQYFYIPWYTLAIWFFFSSLLLMTLSLENNKPVRANPYPLYPRPNGPVSYPGGIPINTNQVPPYYYGNQVSQAPGMPYPNQQTTYPNQPALNQQSNQQDGFNINVEKLKQLAELHNQGIISDLEYEEKKKGLMNNI